MAILPDDIKTAQDQQRRAAREAARVAAGLTPREPKRIGIERPKGRGLGRSSFRMPKAVRRRVALPAPVPIRQPDDLQGRTPCECGRGFYPMGRASRFCPGHDSRRARIGAAR